MEKETAPYVLSMEMLVAKNHRLANALEEAIKELQRKEASYFVIGHCQAALTDDKITTPE